GLACTPRPRPTPPPCPYTTPFRSRVKRGEPHRRMSTHRIAEEEHAFDSRKERIANGRDDLIVKAGVIDADARTVGASHIETEDEQIVSLEHLGCPLHVGADGAPSESVDQDEQRPCRWIAAQPARHRDFP